jgi:multiple antibiotic resistance protein
MIGLFLSVFASLFSVVNPLGAMPVFIALTKEMSDRERRATAIRTSIYFVLILLLFFFTGAFIISFFGISLDAMRIAGGFIIFLSGHSLLRGDMAKSRTVDKKVQQERYGEGRHFSYPDGYPHAQRSGEHLAPHWHYSQV